ncbi:MAG: hypothetical protein IT183_07750 [Acidobacteria bacterium]|nr:hypothetical protein [Acidobacteriota bacterium]
MRTAAHAGALLILLLVGTVPTFAQDREPLPIVAADLRGFYSGLGQDSVTAADLGVTPEQLPTRGLGGVAGVHVYPLRGRTMALGVGAEAMIARGRAQQKDATTGDPVGLPVEQRLISMSPQISLNFGHRDGWSYLSAGMGRLSFETFEGALPPAELPPVKSTINMGGGARWFITSHVAFTFDVRFYLTRPEAASDLFPGRQRSRLTVLSAGFGFK